MSRGASWPLTVLLVLLSSSDSSAQSAPSGLSLVLAQRAHADGIKAMARDGQGYVWAISDEVDTPVPTTEGALIRSKPGGRDGILQRFAPDGSLAYSTYIGTSGYDYLFGVAVDAAGHVYVTGVTMSPDFPTTPGAFDRLCGVDGTCRRQAPDQHLAWDVFVMKLTPDGRSVVYSTFLGGADTDEPRRIVIDALGRAVVVGLTYSIDFPVTLNAHQSGKAGAYDAFYARISADGSRLDYSTYFGGTAADEATGVAIDVAGDAYIAGWTSSRNMPVKNALKATFPPNAGGQGFLARFGAHGGLAYSTYIGGSNSDYAYGVAVSSESVYLSGKACSLDFPAAPRPASTSGCNWAAFVTKLRPDGAEVQRTVLFDGSYYDDGATAIEVDENDVVYVTGMLMSPDVPMSPDAAQVASAGWDAFFAAIPMASTASSDPWYATYHGGGGEDSGLALALDGAGGAWIAGRTRSADYPAVNAKQNTSHTSFIAHYAVTGAPAPESDDIVLHARDASVVGRNWQLRADTSAAGDHRMWNPDAGVPKIGSAAAAPSSYFELTFRAEAGVPYHLWLRMKADNDHWANDSVFVQFSDSVASNGTPQWRIGTTSSTTVSLEDCTGCGERGWGWNDNGYNVPGPLVTFETSGTHTIRIQQREDGISIDQVVLSSRTYISTAPGTPKDDDTILAPSDGQSTAPPPPPPPPPPSDPREIVMYVAAERLAGGQNWIQTSDESAAGGARLLNRDAGQAKLSLPSASGSDYFEVQFTADAGVPYHLWVRSQATNDHWTNDSAFVQFSDSVDASGNPIWRIGSDSATYVSTENCSGCGMQGWGWNDNAYGGFAAPIYFAKSGVQRVRVLRREDGISIDQIVLSAGRYLNASPGLAKNDRTIVQK